MSDPVDLSFLVQGTEPVPYSVSAKIDGPHLTMRCNCRAGASRQLCKHKLNLLMGDVTALASHNPNDVALLVQLAEKSEVDALVWEVIQAEQNIEAAQQRTEAARTALAKAIAR